MKLKKLLAAVTAAALAVTTMAVTSFTASAAIANGNGATLEPFWGSNGQYMVKYGAELSSAQWKECYGISFNVSFADGVGESFGGKLSHTKISSVSLEYNNTDAIIDGDNAVISYKSSSPLDAAGEQYNTWSYFLFESWWGNDMTVNSYTFLDKDGNDLKETFTPPPVATKWTKESAGSYSFTSIDRPEGADYGSADIVPEEESIPLSDLLPAGKTAADVRKITVTAGVGGWQSFNGAVGTNIFKEDGTSDWADVKIKPAGEGGVAGTVTGELAAPYGVDPEYTIKLQSYYMNYGTTINVTITVECAEGEEPGEVSVTVTPATATVKAGETVQLTAAVTGKDDAVVTWASTNTDVATVNTSGLVTGVAKGSCEIRALVDGEFLQIPTSFSVVTVTEEGGNTPVDPKPPVDPTPDDPTHTHTPATVWSSDATNHWHTCSGCTDKLDLAAHTSDNGTVTTPATATTAGTKTYKCSVCGYVIKIETIPATGTSSTPDPWIPHPGVAAPVIPTSGVKNGNAPTINGKDGWEAVAAEITAASDGDKLIVDMNSATKVPSTVFKAIAGKDVDLVLNLNSSIKWTINGLSVTSTSAVDFDVTKNTKHIPNEVVDKAEGSHKKQISLDHNGSFGCTAVMSYDVGTQYNGLYANLFYYNRKAKELELIDCSPISGGKANFRFTHASDYLITISDEPLGDYEDVSSAAGITSDNSGADSIAFCSVLTVITLAFGFVVYKKRRHN